MSYTQNDKQEITIWSDAGQPTKGVHPLIILIIAIVWILMIADVLS